MYEGIYVEHSDRFASDVRSFLTENKRHEYSNKIVNIGATFGKNPRKLNPEATLSVQTEV
jgi:hypothetical protein